MTLLLFSLGFAAVLLLVQRANYVQRSKVIARLDRQLGTYGQRNQRRINENKALPSPYLSKCVKCYCLSQP